MLECPKHEISVSSGQQCRLQTQRARDLIPQGAEVDNGEGGAERAVDGGGNCLEGGNFDGDGEDVTQLLSNTKDGAQITFFHEKLKTLNFTY